MGPHKVFVSRGKKMLANCRPFSFGGAMFESLEREEFARENVFSPIMVCVCVCVHKKMLICLRHENTSKEETLVLKKETFYGSVEKNLCINSIIHTVAGLRLLSLVFKSSEAVVAYWHRMPNSSSTFYERR